MGAGLTSGRDRKVTSSVMPRVKRSWLILLSSFKAGEDGGRRVSLLPRP